MAQTSGAERKCPGCGMSLVARTTSDGAEVLVDERGRLHLCPRAVVPKPAPRRDAPRHEGPREGPRREGPRHEGPRREGPRHDGPRREGPRHDGPRREGPRHERPRREELRREKLNSAQPQKPVDAVRPARPHKAAARPRPVQRPPRQAPGPRRVPAPAPEPTTWDVLANRHVRCAKCHEPVLVHREGGSGPGRVGRVVLAEIDGSAAHDCAREPLTLLTLARVEARSAVERTLRMLAERQAAAEREPDEPPAVATAPAPALTAAARPRRPPRRDRMETASAHAATSRECPSCGKLMAGSGDTQVCLHCGA